MRTFYEVLFELLLGSLLFSRTFYLRFASLFIALSRGDLFILSLLCLFVNPFFRFLLFLHFLLSFLFLFVCFASFLSDFLFFFVRLPQIRFALCGGALLRRIEKAAQSYTPTPLCLISLFCNSSIAYLRRLVGLRLLRLCLKLR